jgi:hypothetical protein
MSIGTVICLREMKTIQMRVMSAVVARKVGGWNEDNNKPLVERRLSAAQAIETDHDDKMSLTAI